MNLTSRETVKLYRTHNGFEVVAYCGATRVHYRQVGNTKVATVSMGTKSYQTIWPLYDDPSDGEIIEQAVRHARTADGTWWLHEHTTTGDE
jgi:hypothetical protein